MNILIRKQPFSKGGMRYAFLVKDNGVYFVAKESKYENKHTSFDFHMRDVTMQLKAREVCAAYNKELWNKGARTNFVDYAPAFIYQIPARPLERQFLPAEPLLPGNTEFEKYTVNNGFVMPGKYAPGHVISHYSLEHFDNEMGLFDVQGIGSLFTDPQFCTFAPSDQYGAGNCGEEAITTYLGLHTCNQICDLLKLPKYTEDPVKPQIDATENKVFCATCYKIIDLGNPVKALPPFPYKCATCKK